jgi:signal transduction histidine kinase
MLDDLGLEAALEKYVKEYQRRYGLEVDYAARGLGRKRMPSAVEIAVYRIIQEGLTNVARHANAASVSILVEQTRDRARLIIEDDGRGFEPARIDNSGDSLGLFGMKERAELLGGRFDVESRPGAGTCLRVEIPLPV